MRITYTQIACGVIIGFLLSSFGVKRNTPLVDKKVRDEIRQLVYTEKWREYDAKQIPKLARMIDWKKVRQLRRK